MVCLPLQQNKLGTEFMRIRVLGCSGGIGLGFHTSSYLIDQRILIDAGTGVGELTLAEMEKIDYIFITHAHMDHIACLPLLVDTTITHRNTPVTILGSQITIDLLKAHIFNNAIWPDFSVIPTAQNPFIRYQVLQALEAVCFDDTYFTPIPVEHSIPTVAYQLTTCAGDSFVICGDTTAQEHFWQHINAIPNLKGLAIETAFSDEEINLARMAKHLSPQMLIGELSKLDHHIPIHVMHLKPGQTETIIRELIQHASSFQIGLLSNNQIIEI
jgi:cAMP phosphodiesterase